MAKRFTSTKVWDEDWFLEMPNEYKLFWYYVLSACDHAGLFKVNLRSFCGLNEVKVSADKALSYFNAGKQRIRKVSDSIWYIEDFFVFQYGTTFNVNNPLHRGIKTLYDQIDLKLTSIRGLKVVYDTLKEKVIYKDKESIKEEGGVGEEENLDITRISPKMISVFKAAHPKYPIDRELDMTACREIAYKIAKANGWSKESTTNGKMNEVLEEWQKIIDFTKEDKWFSTRSISDHNKEFQRIIQSIYGKKQSTKSSVGKTLDRDQL